MLKRLVAASLLFSAACGAEIVELDWAAHDGQPAQHAIPPEGLFEVCSRLEQGQAVAWAFTADQPLDFNVHYHDGDKVEYPEKREAVADASDVLVTKLDQAYCWMWVNQQEKAVSLSWTLQPGASAP